MTTRLRPTQHSNSNIDANDTTVECNKDGVTPILIRRRTVVQQGVQGTSSSSISVGSALSTGTSSSSSTTTLVLPVKTVDYDPAVPPLAVAVTDDDADEVIVTTTANSDSSSKRRRSTFYVPLTSSGGDDHHHNSHPTATADSADDSLDLSACSLDWSLNESIASSDRESQDERRSRNNVDQVTATIHRLEITVNEQKERTTTTTDYEQDSKQSTPIKSYGKSRSRTNILNLTERISLSPAGSPLKEKSKTLPQNLSQSPMAGSSCFPAKHSFLLKSSPKISMASGTVITASASPPPQVIPLTAKSPRKSLSFIRRSHSTKVSRSSSLLRSFTSKQQQQQENGQGEDQGEQTPPRMVGLNAELLERLYKIAVPGDFDESLRRIFFKERPEDEDRITTANKGAQSFLLDSSNTSYGSSGGGAIGNGKQRTFDGGGGEQQQQQQEREEEDAIHSGNNSFYNTAA